MEDHLLEHEENIAKILDRFVTVCKQNGLSELADKGERVLKHYHHTKN